MTDKPTIDRKVGALDSCLIVNRVISFLCDRYEDVVGLADQYRTGIAGAMDFILERGLEEAFTARAIMQQAEKEEEYLPPPGVDQDKENQSHQVRRVRQAVEERRV